MAILRARVMVRRNGVVVPGYPIVRRVETALKAHTFDTVVPAGGPTSVISSPNVTRFLGGALQVDRTAPVTTAGNSGFTVLPGGGFIMLGGNELNEGILVTPPAGAAVRVKGGYGYSA